MTRDQMKRAMALREQLPGDEMLAEQPEDAGTVGPAPVESRKSPVSSQSAEPDARARLRDFVMSRLEAKPYELAPPSRMERLRETEDALAPGANDILAGVWGSIGKPVPGGGWATNAAAPMRSEREKARALLEARRQAQTATASTLLGREDALASDTQKRADEMKADEAARGDRLKRDESEMNLKRDQLAEEKRIHDAQIERDKQKLSRHGAGGPTFVSPGYELQLGAAPKPDELGKFRDQVAVSNLIGQQVGELRSMIQQHGSMMVGDNSARAANIVNSIRSNLKEAERLGALSGSDYQLLDAQLADPTSLKSLLTPNSSMIASLDQLTKNLESGVATRAGSLGVRKSGAAQPGAAPTAAAPAAKVRVSNGKETFDIDAADLADAKRDGFQVVR